MKTIILRWTCIGAAFGLVAGFGALLAMHTERLHSSMGLFFASVGWPSYMIAWLFGAGGGHPPEWAAWFLGVFALACAYASIGALIGILICFFNRLARVTD